MDDPDDSYLLASAPVATKPKKTPVKTYSRSMRKQQKPEVTNKNEKPVLENTRSSRSASKKLLSTTKVDDNDKKKKNCKVAKKSEPLKQSPEKLQCIKCSRSFAKVVGLKRHTKSCKGVPVENGDKNVADNEIVELEADSIVGNSSSSNSNSGTPKKCVSDELKESIRIFIRDDFLENDPLAEETSPEVDKPPDLTPLLKAEPVETPVDGKVEPGKCHCCGEDLVNDHTMGAFDCTDCKKYFKLKSSLERHRRVIHNEGETFNCPECGARCPDKGTLARHMYTHTGLKPYACPICKTEFSRKYHLVRHNMQTGCDGSEKASFPCQVCGRVFNRKDNLREHLRAHAGQTKRKRTYKCEHCKKEFCGSTLLHIHKRTHTGERPYKCDLCDMTFPSSGAMKKHRRKHTGERPYECRECYAKFSAKETLNRHMRTHTGDKPHSCRFCGKSFIQASQLRAHIFHHSGENGFTCDQCGKAFNRRTRLHLHIKYVHEGAKPFICNQCGKPFVRKEDLSRHQILHTGVKAHKCPICEKCFAMKSSLKIHLLTHTKEPPRSCDECGRAFIRQDCLLRHMRTKHRDMLEEIMAEAEKKKLQQQLLAAAADAAIESGEPDEPASVMSEQTLARSIMELLTLLVDETTLKAFGWPESPVDTLIESVIKRCGHEPVGSKDMPYSDRLRENAKLLFTVVIDDTAVKTLLNNQTVDDVILHVLHLAKS